MFALLVRTLWFDMKAFNLITKQLVEALSDHTHMEDTEVDQESHKTEKKD